MFLFLADFAEGHVGAERPSDLFSGSRSFRVAERESGEIVFLQRESLWFVAAALEDEFDVESGVGAPIPASPGDPAVCVVLEDGSRLTGSARYELPQQRSRLQDFLNSPETFLALYQDEEVVLINKSRIAQVTMT